MNKRNTLHTRCTSQHTCQYTRTVRTLILFHRFGQLRLTYEERKKKAAEKKSTLKAAKGAAAEDEDDDDEEDQE